MCLFELRISGAEHLPEPLDREVRRHKLEREEHRLHARHHLGGRNTVAANVNSAHIL